MVVVATIGNLGPAGYPDLGSAFAAINAGTHQGVIGVTINCDTVEAVSAVLNASGTGPALYASVTVNPNGTRSVTGNLAAPLVDLNGADNVMIDGLNGGGNSLMFCNGEHRSSSGHEHDPLHRRRDHPTP